MKYLSFFICLLCISKSPAQEILIGPVIGPQVSWTRFNDRNNASNFKQLPFFGFHAGGQVSFRVNKRFFLHTSLLYSMKGKKLESKSDPDFLNKTTYHYLEMPIVYTVEFKHKVGTSKQYKWYLGLGPDISYLLGTKGTMESSYLKEINMSPLDYKMIFNKEPADGYYGDNVMVVNNVNRVQLGINASAGIVLEPYGTQKIMITLRYEFGHSFFSRDGTGYVFNSYYVDDLKTTNQGVRLSAAYLIDLKLDQKKRGKSTSKIKTNRRK